MYMVSQFTSCRLVFLWLVMMALAVRAEQPITQNTSEIELGRRIYQEGLLPSGQPLHAQRANMGELEGEAAACIQCHRKSGMGSLEGNIQVLPITGRFLFKTNENPMALLDPRAAKNVTQQREPYTDESFAKVVREGIKIGGVKLNALMPTYSLNESDLKALTAYLRQLSLELSPGVGADTLKFATIITPEVDAKRREALISMMRAAFQQRNASQQNISGRMRMPLDLLPRTSRNWELSVWELQGDPESWAAQLAEFQQSKPVFAVISGVSDNTWAPINNFCEQEKLPCLFPSVPLTSIEQSYYALYFSQGVLLEANVLGKYLLDQGKKAPPRVVQIYRDNEVGRQASKALLAALKESDIRVENRLLSNNISDAFNGLSNQDCVMLWLNSSDLTKLSKSYSKKMPAVMYISGVLDKSNYGDFPKDWKTHLRVIFPYELGDRPQKNFAQLSSWLKTWRLPEVDEAFQSEIFFNLLLLTDLTSQMLDNLYQDYLIERAEDMLNLGANVTNYPHLSLAQGQRFASKGAYIARIGKNGKLTADSEWIVP